VSPLRALVGKELRQLRRSRGVMLSATLLPLFLMVLSPIGQYLSLSGVPVRGMSSSGVPPGLAGIERPEQMLSEFFLPFVMAVVGLLVPAVAAMHTIVTERERRTIELLIALPLRVRDVLLAKLIAMLALSAMVLLPLFAIDAAWLLWLDIASPGRVAIYLLLLLAGATCSISMALVLTLLARDLRTANQLNGVLVGPLILALLGVFMFVQGDVRWPLAIGLLLAAAGVGLVIALRWLTFERYLS
jgi:ABC-2 type transport system permease protein